MGRGNKQGLMNNHILLHESRLKSNNDGTKR